jgi:hypothetical protein
VPSAMIANTALRARTRLARVADTIELIILAVLLPLGVIAGGWV